MQISQYESHMLQETGSKYNKGATTFCTNWSYRNIFKVTPCRRHYTNWAGMSLKHESLWQCPSSLEMVIVGESASADKRQIPPQLKPDHPWAAENPDTPPSYNSELSRGGQPHPIQVKYQNLELRSNLPAKPLSGFSFSLLALIQPIITSTPQVKIATASLGSDGKVRELVSSTGKRVCTAYIWGEAVPSTGKSQGAHLHSSLPLKFYMGGQSSWKAAYFTMKIRLSQSSQETLRHR